MSTLNHLVVFRSTMARPGVLERETRRCGADPAPGAESLVAQMKWRLGSIIRVYGFLVFGTVACAFTAGAIMMTSII